MDRQLADRLNNLSEQNERLKRARNSYLLKEASRKHFEATLIKGAEGKSHSEKLVNAQATPEWLEFAAALAELEGVFEFEKLKYEILDKAFLSEYATFKLDDKTIKRG